MLQPGASKLGAGLMKRLILLAWVSALILFSISGCDGGHQSTAAQQPDAESAQSAADAALAKANAALAAAKAASLAWAYMAHPAKMITGGVDHFASITSANQVNFAFPYQGPQNGHLIVRKMASSKHFEILFTIDRGQLMCANREDCTVEVKFDNEPPKSYSATSGDDADSTVLFLGDDPDVGPDDADVIEAELNKAKVVKIEPAVYQNGSPVFEFHVEGFTDAKLMGATPTPRSSSSP